MKKILSLIFTLLLLFAVFTLYTYAEEAIVEEETIVEDAAEEAIVEDTEVPTVTETILAWCEEHTVSLFSGGSLLLSGILAILFKKGLLPSLATWLAKINKDLDSGVANVKTIAEAMSQSTDANLQRVAAKIDPFLEEAQRVTDMSKKMEDSLVGLQDQLEASSTERAVLSEILQRQTDFLYSVFMSANLPEYQKQQMGERYNEMKKVIDTLYQGAKNEGEIEQ